ncbi:MAG: Hsp70 family protein [Polyangiaceae bacterium]|nr:Hsp70 family protein [Polyangiaceae bacterium]
MLRSVSVRPQYVGIDLGTTNSTAAVFDGDKVTLVRNAQGGSLTPSVVRIDARGNVTVGDRARRFLESDPQNTRSELKRLMGTAEQVEFVAARVKKKPEEVAAEVLKSLRADVKEHLGFVPANAVIAVPALFEIPQSSATSEAARLAGFERVELIQEPVASALAAGWSAEDTSGAWLVYDLGGGTFDVSLLETRDGLLRVVGHDGDNFLGGRDFDWAIVDHVLRETSSAAGCTLSRADAALGPSLRKLKSVVEEAKIELTRAQEATIILPAAFEIGGRTIDVDVHITRDILNGLTAPLVDRSIDVCKRLVKAHGLTLDQIGRVVLVGGPTVMPGLRSRVKEALGAPFSEGLDPMTLVAQGAALYAATAGLDARPASAPEAAAHKLWLQYPAMTSDLTPHVVGRIAEGSGSKPAGLGKPVARSVRISRADGGFQTQDISLDGDGAFVALVELQTRRPNVFKVELFDGATERKPVPCSPSTFTIVQGLTIGDPPLSRTIGVALADDTVRVYFERGAPLPARRTFMHQTVETIARIQGQSPPILKIPIVQGELSRAHLCRLVGTLEIPGNGITATLPAGSQIELTLELDRGGHLSARAFIPALSQVFEKVAHLLVPDASPEVLTKSIADLRSRMGTLRVEATRRNSPNALGRLTFVECAIAEAERDVEAAKGGDADAAQKARRSLIDAEAILDEQDSEKKWPELDHEARLSLSAAASFVSEYGTKAEQKLLQEATDSVERARKDRDAVELERQLRVVRNLTHAAFNRHPESTKWLFEDAASELDRATDLVRAKKLVDDGRRAIDRNDMPALRTIVRELQKLMPADVRERQRGYESGVR